MGWHGPVPAEKPQNLDSWGSTDSFIESVFIKFYALLRYGAL